MANGFAGETGGRVAGWGLSAASWRLWIHDGNVPFEHFFRDAITLGKLRRLYKTILEKKVHW